MQPPDDKTLEELAMTLGMAESFGSTWYDAEEQRLLFLECEPEHEPSEDERPLFTSIRANPQRYHLVEPVGTHGRLSRFLASIDDAELADVLRDAKRGGRGAYRRVRSALRRHTGSEDLWHAFSEQDDRELALDWLRARDLVEEPWRPVSTP